MKTTLTDFNPQSLSAGVVRHSTRRWESYRVRLWIRDIQHRTGPCDCPVCNGSGIENAFQKN